MYLGTYLNFLHFIDWRHYFIGKTYFISWSTTELLFLVWPDRNCEGDVLADRFLSSVYGGCFRWYRSHIICLIWQAFITFSRIVDIWETVFTQLSQIFLLLIVVKSMLELTMDLMVFSIWNKAHFLLEKL